MPLSSAEITLGSGCHSRRALSTSPAMPASRTTSMGAREPQAARAMQQNKLSALFHNRIKKSIHAAFARQVLRACTRRPPTDRNRLRGGVGMPREKAVDTGGILRGEQRARRIDYASSGREQRPQRFQQPLLPERERGNVTGAPMQLHIGLAANDPRRRTRRIKQDALKAVPVPP